MRSLLMSSAVAAALGALVMSYGSAQAMATLPAVQKSGQIEYVTGGVGADESAAIESASKQWPLTLEFAVKDKQRADFAADVETIIRDAKGHRVLQVDSGGPILLAKLEPGHYAVDATLGGKTLHEKVVVKRGQPAKAVLVWPTGTGDSRS